MTEPRHDPETTALSELLRQYRPDPDLPPRFAEAVWRKLEKPTARPSWLEDLAGWLLRPRIALSGAVAMLLIGAVVGVLSTSDLPREKALSQYTRTVAPHLVR